jgi:hypothetical protein
MVDMLLNRRFQTFWRDFSTVIGCLYVTYSNQSHRVDVTAKHPLGDFLSIAVSGV